MQEQGVRNGAYGADKFGFKNLAEVRWNLTAPRLYEYAISQGEASMVEGGALCAETGHHTGRSPKDKHTVVDDLTCEFSVVGRQPQNVEGELRQPARRLRQACRR